MSLVCKQHLCHSLTFFRAAVPQKPRGAAARITRRKFDGCTMAEGLPVLAGDGFAYEGSPRVRWSSHR